MKFPVVTPNQIVASNLASARALRGWTQEEAAEKLEPFLGTRWSKATFSAAERSVAGKRVRQFTADEVVAFACAFELPIGWFFLPPPPDPDRPFAFAGMTRTEVSWEEVERRARDGSYVLPGVLPYGALVDLVFAITGMEERVAELLESIPGGESTEYQRRIKEYAGTEAKALIKGSIGDIATWVRNLSELAEFLSIIEAVALLPQPEVDSGIAPPIQPLRWKRAGGKGRK